MKNFEITPTVIKNPMGTKTIGTATNIDMDVSLIFGDANATGQYRLYNDEKILLDNDTIVIPLNGWAGVEQSIYNSFATLLGITLIGS